MLSRLVVSIPYFLTGLAILESVFNVPGGLGNLVFSAIRNQDTPVVVGAMVVVGGVSLLARLVMVICYPPSWIPGSGTVGEVGGGCWLGSEPAASLPPVRRGRDYWRTFRANRLAVMGLVLLACSWPC